MSKQSENKREGTYNLVILESKEGVGVKRIPLAGAKADISISCKDIEEAKELLNMILSPDTSSFYTEEGKITDISNVSIEIKFSSVEIRFSANVRPV